MPATVIGVIGLNEGFVGNISHSDFPLRTPRTINPTDTINVNFGDGMVLNSNDTYSSIQQFLAGGGTFTANIPICLAVANAKTNSTFPVAGNNGVFTPAGTYAPGQVADGLVFGSMDVQCRVGTPTAGGNVYVRVAANGSIPAGVVGGFEAQADGANTVLYPNLKWKTGRSLTQNGVYTMTILTRQLP